MPDSPPQWIAFILCVAILTGFTIAAIVYDHREGSK